MATRADGWHIYQSVTEPNTPMLVTSMYTPATGLTYRQGEDMARRLNTELCAGFAAKQQVAKLELALENARARIRQLEAQLAGRPLSAKCED